MFELINKIILKKGGNREFILAADSMGSWFAAIGNKSKCLTIGETITYGDDVDFEATGSSAREALENLLTLIEHA